ncbi:MIC26 protein, partial [Polypterus senegalus]|nr:MIC26 protein [Polypterus senegalus]
MTSLKWRAIIEAPVLLSNGSILIEKQMCIIERRKLKKTRKEKEVGELDLRNKGILHCTLKLAAIPTGIGLSLLPFRVHAGSEDKQGGISLKVEELSLYTKPEDDYKYVVETTELEESISTVRKSVEPYTTWVQDFLTVLKPKIEHSVHLGKESYEFLKNPPPGFYPRFGVIGFTGIIGLFLARGSRIKKLIYPSGLMALSTSLYYPQQAVTVAKVSINTANSK